MTNPHADTYEFLQSESKLKLRSLIKQFHDMHYSKVIQFKLIDRYRKEIINSDISYDELYKIYTGERPNKIFIPSSLVILKDKIENNVLILMIKQFMQLVTKDIPEVALKLRVEEFVYSIPYKEVIKFWRLYFKGFARIILEGTKYRVKGLGAFFVRLHKRNIDRKAVNWGDSYKYKKYLIENGITPKSYEHPDGEPWLVHFTDDEFVAMRWSKNGARIKNAAYYRFKCTSYYVEIDREYADNKLLTKSSILDSKVIGNMQKAIQLYTKFSDIRTLYAKN